MTATAGLFAYGTGNLGDDMQSLAILGHLRGAGRFMDRDALADFEGEDTLCVFNSRFLQGKDFRAPSGRVKPVWHGFGFGREQLAGGEWRQYLKSHEPIGCRDLYSAERLQALGIEAFWTGCLTLFMGEALGLPRRERRGVVFVDLPPEAEAVLPREIVKRAVHLSTFAPPWLLGRPLERFAQTAAILDRIARAELVVTRRLHAALPAASLGTPVVAVPDPKISQARHRFSGFDRFVPTVYLDDAAKGLRRIDWNHLEAPGAPRELRERLARLRAKLDSPPAGSNSALGEIGRRQRIRNPLRAARPGSVRLRLAAQTFDLDVLGWSTSHIDTSLRGFPGLEKLALTVEICPAESREWVACGNLRELAASRG